MEQLGNQTDLQHLELSFNAAYRCGTSPFLQLAVGPVSGLDQLSKLSLLEYFSVTGLFHEVGSTEIEWMARHWSLHKKIYLRIYDTKDNTELTTCDWRELGRLTPDYRHCYPFIRVVKFDRERYWCHKCSGMPDNCLDACWF